jgi:hypothetical protein
MKRILILFFAFCWMLSLPSCYLFKPVQKTCPAYSSVISTDNSFEVLTCELVIKGNEEQL